jgi:hypothetical protein
MVIGNLCTFFNVHNTNVDSISLQSGDAITWHPDQVHFFIFNTLHFILNVGGGEEVSCNLTQVVFNTPGGTSVSG